MRPSPWALVALVAVLVVLVTGFEYRLRAGYFEAGLGRIEAYAATDDPRTIVIHYLIGAGDEVLGPRVVENDRTVTVEVRISVWFPGRGTFKNLSATFMQVPITLKNPLGDRAVIDSNTGKRIQRSPAS
jgi:hypothetical protein